MYNKPMLVRHGSFRELTRFGGDNGYDLAILVGITGCDASKQQIFCSPGGTPTTTDQGSRS